MNRVVLLVAALIIYGSLYPWQLEWSRIPADPIAAILRASALTPNRFVFRDVVVNVLLYVPLGASLYIALKRRGWGTGAAVLSVASGAALSLSVELLQLMDRRRVSSLLDLACNTLGSAAGVMIASALQEPLNRLAVRRLHPPDLAALSLLVCWIAQFTFPFFPVLGRTVLWEKIRAFASSPALSPVAFASALGAWVVIGLLVQASGIRNAAKWVGLGALLTPAQIFLIGRQPVLADFAGAMAGWVTYVLFGRRTKLRPAIALAFLALLAVRGLAPFEISTSRNAFTWVPFAAPIVAPWETSARVLLAKAFYYGSAVWLLRSSGLRLARATIIVTALLAFIEIIQVFLPGRTPETTDPVIAVIMGVLFASARRLFYSSK